jgi:alpha-L-fucosidase 2
MNSIHASQPVDFTRRYRNMVLVLIAAGTLGVSAGAAGTDTLLWYESPTTNWNEALPVGNGRLGAMIFGGVTSERLQLNEDSLWSGAPQEADNPKALEVLPQIRQLLFDGKYSEAERLANRSLICLGRGSGRGRGGRVPYGCYQTLGDLNLKFAAASNAVPMNYRRELDVASAVARVSYELGGVKFKREIFVSQPDQVMVVRLTADRPGALSLRASLSRPEAASILNLGNDQLAMHGQLWDGTAWAGMKYVARLQAKVEGGKVFAADGALNIEQANAVTLFLTAATDYTMQLPNWRQGDPAATTASQRKAIHAVARGPCAGLSGAVQSRDFGFGADRRRQFADGRPAQGGQGGRHRSLVDHALLQLWPLSADQQFASGRDAGQPSGAVGGWNSNAVEL